MCGILDVSRSGYYDWTVRGQSQHASSTHQLDRWIRAIFAKHRQQYGAPRIAKTLRHEGLRCSENRIGRRIQRLGLKAIQAKKFKVTPDSTHSKPVAPDLLEQNLHAEAPNQKRTSDLTYVWTNEGWLYLAVVMDLFTSDCGLVDAPTDGTTIGVSCPHHGLVPSRLPKGYDPPL